MDLILNLLNFQKNLVSTQALQMRCMLKTKQYGLLPISKTKFMSLNQKSLLNLLKF